LVSSRNCIFKKKFLLIKIIRFFYVFFLIFRFSRKVTNFDFFFQFWDFQKSSDWSKLLDEKLYVFFFNFDIFTKSYKFRCFFVNLEIFKKFSKFSSMKFYSSGLDYVPVIYRSRVSYFVAHFLYYNILCWSKNVDRNYNQFLSLIILTKMKF